MDGDGCGGLKFNRGVDRRQFAVLIQSLLHRLPRRLSPLSADSKKILKERVDSISNSESSYGNIPGESPQGLVGCLQPLAFRPGAALRQLHPICSRRI